MILFADSIKSKFKNVDFYGFNFCQDNFDTYATHYFNDRNADEAKKTFKHT